MTPTLVLILLLAADDMIEERPVPAHEVFRCDFEDAADHDFDGWPDGWTRVRGPGLRRSAKSPGSAPTKSAARAC